ncbi:MAG: sigma-54-dependent Fis family transcriptional regulator [Acidobacteria bacterium]|nr:sigma-54-dependent Fis family transcriptional regulator [Acidobacteriota bacterium]MCK6681855.1 sigma-54 dependent transcriptional regulator [Thermoanaerobaculia bacterium]
MGSTRNTILIIEDEAGIRFSLVRFFMARGFTVFEAESATEAAERFRLTRPDAVLLDYCLPDGDGLSVLRAIRGMDTGVPVVILTAHGTIDLAVKAIKEGAEQFFTKPVELAAVAMVVDRAIENQRARNAKAASNFRRNRQAADPFLGASPAIRRLAEQARRVLGSSSPVLIQGETGSGKGLLASWLHQNGPRADEPFIDLNCAGLSRDFFESELFGHEKGAFTGAVASKPGLFELAHRGSIFLDEIGDVDLGVQPKLLKVLEEQCLRRLGEVKERQVDVRLIAATHQDLDALATAGRFRRDLFYRIAALPLLVPPLRERPDDIPGIAESLLSKISEELGRPGLRLAEDAGALLSSQPWPGNVRELRNVLERAALFTDGPVIETACLAQFVVPPAQGRPRTLLQAERHHIAAVLAAEHGNVTQASATLGLSRSALYEKMKKHGLTGSQKS